MSFEFLIYSVLLITTYTSAIQPKPKYMKICHTKDPDYEKCTVKAAQDLINSIPHGDRKYGIPDLKPLIIPVAEIQSAGDFKLSFTDLEFHGVNELIINDIKINDKSMVVKGHFNQLRFIGPYKASGKILVLPIEGHGPANISADNIDLIYKCSWETYEENGHTLGRITESNLQYEVQKIHFHFENLFNGDKKLGDHVNNFMNENWEEVNKDLKPTVKKIIAGIIDMILANFYKRISQNDIFPE